MGVQAPRVQPMLIDSLIDEDGFSIELTAERELTDDEITALAPLVHALSHPILADDPYHAKGLVAIEDDALWVSVFVTGAGPINEAVTEFADAWFRDLWLALHLGAQDGSDPDRTPQQLLTLARDQGKYGE